MGILVRITFMIAFLISTEVSSYSNVIYVSRNGVSNNSCWTGGASLACDSLQLAMMGLRVRFNYSDTTIVAVRSDVPYTLPANTMITTVSGASTVAIVGSESDTGIECSHGAGLTFSNSFNITLANLTLRGCGRSSSLRHGDPVYSVGLLFHTCQDVAIDNIVVLSHSGVVGIVLQDVTGIVHIRNSVYTSYDRASNIGGLWVEMSSPVTFDTNYFITGCQFEYNGDVNSSFFSTSRGGGLMISLQYSISSISICSCAFTGNTAQHGGGLYLQLDSIGTNVTISNCSFHNNRGQVGSAIYLTSPPPLPKSTLHDCVVLSNSIFSDNRPLHHMILGTAAAYSDGVSLCLSQDVVFVKNQASALVISGATLVILESSKINFSENTGHNGGALALLDSAYMVVSSNSNLTFTQNKAQLHGGAIYSSYYNYEESVGYRSCFVQYANHSIHPDYWNVLFWFKENKAGGQTNSIYIPSIFSCVWPLIDGKMNISSAFCWSNWHYFPNQSCSQHIETAPGYSKLATTSEALEISTYPGKTKRLPLQFFNDEGKDITSTTIFNSFLNVDDAFVTEYTTGNKVTLFGKPGTVATLTLGTLRPRVLKTEVNVIFWLCPPGFIVAETDDNRYGCVCQGHFRDSVICDEESFQSFLHWGKILSYESSIEEVLAGPWRVYLAPPNISQQIPGYFLLPNDSFLLNEFMCERVHRTGFLCSECLNGTSAPVFSLDYACVNCTAEDVSRNWVLFIVLQTVPVTLLFLVVAVFNISATSGPLNAFIFYSQVIGNPALASSFAAQLSYTFQDSPWIAKVILCVFIFPYGIWNLDCIPTHVLIPPFCVGENMRAIDSFTLNYLTAGLYPLLLIGFLFVCVELHARDFRPLVWLWKHIGNCLGKWRRNWNIRTSIIDTFATLLLLTYTKFCFLSFFLLAPMNTYNSTGDYVGPTRLYFDPSIIYGGHNHIPFMILAIFILVFGVILPPIFLLLYPLMIFQRMLACCRMRGNAVRTYVEAFHGCYKDGTNGTSDCRYFAAVYFGLRIVAFGLMVLSYDHHMQRFIQMVLVYLIVMLFSLVRPYKNSWYNRLDIFILSVLGIVATFGFYNSVVSNNSLLINILMMVAVIIPLMYFLLLAIYRVYCGLRYCWLSRRYLQANRFDEPVDYLEEEEEEEECDEDNNGGDMLILDLSINSLSTNYERFSQNSRMGVVTHGSVRLSQTSSGGRSRGEGSFRSINSTVAIVT